MIDESAMTIDEFMASYSDGRESYMRVRLARMIAAAVQAEREANCAAVCAICADKYPDYGKAELIGGLWEHRITEAGICYKVQPCDAAAIRARNGEGRE